MARTLLASIEDRDEAGRRQLEAEVEDAAATLERLGLDAPDQEAGNMARRAAEQLRSLMFAIRAEELLRDGPPPTGEQLAEADRMRRTHATELDATIEQIRTHIGDTPGSSGGVGST